MLKEVPLMFHILNTYIKDNKDAKVDIDIGAAMFPMTDDLFIP